MRRAIDEFGDSTKNGNVCWEAMRARLQMKRADAYYQQPPTDVVDLEAMLPADTVPDTPAVQTETKLPADTVPDTPAVQTEAKLPHFLDDTLGFDLVLTKASRQAGPWSQRVSPALLLKQMTAGQVIP